MCQVACAQSGLLNFANMYAQQGDIFKAMEFANKALEFCKQNYGDESNEYAKALLTKAEFLHYMVKTQESIAIVKHASEIFKRNVGSKSVEYVAALNNLAEYHSFLGNYQDALSIGAEALGVCKDVFGKTDDIYATSLSNLARYYNELGDYQEAIKHGKEALNIRQATVGKNHANYAQSLNNLAYFYCNIGNYKESERLGTEAANIAKATLGERSPYYATSLSNLAGYKACIGNFQEAIRLATDASDIFYRLYGEWNTDYARVQNSLASYYFHANKCHEAVRIAERVLKNWKQLLGVEHPSYALSLSNIVIFYHYDGNFPERDRRGKECFELGKKLITENFATMTPPEMDNFLNMNAHLVREQHNPTIAYDALLLNKGMRMNAEMGINELIQESGDKEALEMFEHIKMNIIVMNKLLEKPIAERYLDVDSLSDEIERERKQLAVRSKEFGDFTRFFSTYWQDVRDNLKDNEVAIEFGSLSKGEIHVLNHCTRALVLKRDSEEPIDIYLELDSTKDFKTNILANWPTIQQHLKGIKTVYFSPSGELYSTPIENYINDGREYVRVSSTRKIVKSRHDKQTACKPMKLYGGLVYDMTVDDLAKAALQYKLTENKPAQLYAKRSGREVVNQVSFNYLRGTLDEVNSIKGIAKSHKRNCELLSGHLGTEESLRAIDGKKYGILHFATHGFYWTEKEAEDLAEWNRLSFLMMDNKSHKYMEDKSMTRSGLIFSGANIALGGEELPDEMEDGIATAQEISRLDLRGCDLVVLSACQTGLGEVSSEGVFGLQRGFKKAGVNSILMSLWEVDDRATQMLMTEFYKHYLGGKPKRESLRKAQEYVKSQPDYNDPIFWAAFILLDGLD